MAFTHDNFNGQWSIQTLLLEPKNRNFFAESESQQLQQLPAKNLTDFAIAQETALSAEIPFENIILNWLGIDYYYQKE